MRPPAFLLALSLLALALASTVAAQRVRIHHPMTFDFGGPVTSEEAEVNPFTHYRLLVRFVHEDAEQVIRGYYAADGNAAETGADSGFIWRAHFTPDRPGRWRYEASLRAGEMIAISDDWNAGVPIELEHAGGAFDVVDTRVPGEGFLGRDRLTASQGYFRFGASGPFWLKGGADSPENLLAYADFDGTYRHSEDFREGESKPGEGLHRFAPHTQDWTTGDPTWRNGKGKGLIGALNYLAAEGMNAVYFLTMNINGDGKDVWPYLAHNIRDRFDCSKLDQWNIVFGHMQRLGILMHVVTQETENERLLDDGDTGPERQLYYRELIARFAHHRGLVWNLGEENGPANFSPHGQTSEQQRAMASYLKASDPYRHPVVIHTHSHRTQKDELLPALLEHPPLDGLSFQVDNPDHVHEEIIKWRRLSQEAGHEWLIAMDEIGPWQDGAVPDATDPAHDELRRKVLWGSLLAGAAGVEWYFGAHHPHNDLSAEDWRSRENLWEQTRHALAFFDEHLPYWRMQAADELIPGDGDYCFAAPGEVYAAHLPAGAEPAVLDLQDHEGAFEVRWFAPKTGGELLQGSVAQISGPGQQSLGAPPTREKQDWVVLVRRSRR